MMWRRPIIMEGGLVADREHDGRRIETNDAWIAACAIRYAVPLVTHNAKDVSNIPSLDVISEYV